MTDHVQADRDAEERDRKLAQALRWGLPGVTLFGFLAMFGLTSLGPALLVLAAGGLLGAIALLWTSLRSLFGDVAIDEDLDEAAAAARTHATSRAGERKRVALRALKDLEHEHAVGKIDDEDYFRLTARYREDAKAALRELDDQVADYRAKAEALVAKHLARGAAKGREEAAKPARVACAKCGAKNDPDARFCKKCGAGMKAKKKLGKEKTEREREREEEIEELVSPAKAVAAEEEEEEDTGKDEEDAEDEDEEEDDS